MSTPTPSSIATEAFVTNATEFGFCRTTAGILSETAVGGGANWQTLVTSSVPEASQATRLRFDDPQHRLHAPHVLSAWHADVGWHRPVSDLFQFLPDGLSLNYQPVVSSTSLPGEKTTLDRDENSAESPEFAELVAEIAHDIRSPIAVAKQIVGAVAEQARTTGGLSSGELELLDVASMRLVEANKWAEGILVGRCLEQGTPINIRRRFYPPQWRSVAEPLLQGIAARRRINLQWIGWDRSLPRLYLDENQLTRAILNLVSNAIQASPMGSNVEIRVAMQNNVTQRVVLAIEDSGPGLERKLMQQLNSHAPARSDKANLLGSGLGLSTCKSLIAAMGGELHASHSPRGGTLVLVSLPTDDSQSLLRSWLVQDLQARAAAGDKQPREVQLYAIRSTGLNQQFVDTQLQQGASASDFIYRVSHDRWLWFAIAPEGAEANATPNLSAALRRLRDMRQGNDSKSLCQAQLVYRARGIVADMPEQLQSRLTEVAHLLTAQIERLTGGRIPTVDDIGLNPGSIVFRAHGNNTTRQVRQDMPQVVAPKMHRRPAAGEAQKPRSRRSGADVRIDASETVPSPSTVADNAARGGSQELSMAGAGPATAPYSDATGTAPLAAASSSSALASPAASTTKEAELLDEAMTLHQAIAEVASLWHTDLSTIQQTHLPLTGAPPPK